MADKSPAGWALVDEYLGSELASDEEDEKRIKRAELAVAQRYKRKQENASRGARGNRSGGNYNRNRYENPGPTQQAAVHHNHTAQGQQASHYPSQYYGSNWVNGGQVQPVFPVPYMQNGPPYYQVNGHQQNYPGGYQQRTLGPCYYCKGPHLRNACPKLAEQTALTQSKIERAYTTQQ